MDIRLFQQKLQIVLQKTLPGKDAQKKMAIQPFRSLPTINSAKKRSAAVLLLLFQENDDLKFVLTKRTEKMANHRGQISFPGGAIEDKETKEIAALRETEEEIGIPPKSVEILGKLSPLFVPVSGFKMFPIVGWIDEKPTFNLNPIEVEKVIFVSTQDLKNEQNIQSERHRKYDTDFTIPYFALSGEKIWGATAMILAEFREILLIS